MRTLLGVLGSLVLFSAGCMVGEDEATNATEGASVGATARGLTGCRGKAASSIPANGTYVLTTFGGPGDHQPMSCGGYADGTGWYAASRQRYGCGSKIKVTANGKCVVLVTDDYGPDVCVENAAHMPILDVSPRASKELFGTSGAGWSDRMKVVVEEVSAATPLGRCQNETSIPLPPGGDDEPPPPPAPTASAACMSPTLDREVESGTCVQQANDRRWMTCTNGQWVQRASAAGCAMAYGFCDSATLGTSVAPRTCVQAASDAKWYQCNGTGWVSPVDVPAKEGPIGTCSTMRPL